MKKSFSNSRIIIALMLLASSTIAVANNIRIQRVWLTDTNRTANTVLINLNLSWENSWRDSINWDAAWVFFKFREPKDSIWQWRHGHLSKNGNNAGNGPLAMQLVVPEDLKGAFYYRMNKGNGSVIGNEISLRWNYGTDGVSNIDSVEIKIFATEMVYVPDGNFCLGDGNGISMSEGALELKKAPKNYAVITNKWSPLISTPKNPGAVIDPVLENGIRISGLDGLDIDDDRISDFPLFPTGYRAFYCMKYELTQGQYADFLTSISLGNFNDLPHNGEKLNPNYARALQLLDPFFAGVPAETFRHTIALDSTNGFRYTVQRPDRAFGYTNSMRLEAYCQWAGLRPMTELEFEKACRGPLPPKKPGELAWGESDIVGYGTSGSVLSFSGIENGTEVFSDYSYNRRNSIPPIWNTKFKNGDGGWGPTRVGIYANDTSSREYSGASYYGIMDMNRNAREVVISIASSLSRANASYLSHGNGELQDFWNTERRFDVIQRVFGISVRLETTENAFSGFHAVRTAPVFE